MLEQDNGDKLVVGAAMISWRLSTSFPLAFSFYDKVLSCFERQTFNEKFVLQIISTTFYVGNLNATLVNKHQI